MAAEFEIVFTRTFSKDLDKLTKKDRILKKKLEKKLKQLKQNPFEGEKVESAQLEQRRVWVGDAHRLFYDIDGLNVVILHFKQKNKSTYK